MKILLFVMTLGLFGMLATLCFSLVVTLARLHLRGVELYLAGRWTCEGLSADRQAELWGRFRDALGLPEGTATKCGVASDARCFDCGCPQHVGVCQHCGHRQQREAA
jgi:hypothetical protein